MRKFLLFFLLATIIICGCHRAPKRVSERELGVKYTPLPVPAEMVYEIQSGAKGASPQVAPGAGQRRWEWQITPEEEAKEPGEEVAKEVPTEFVFEKIPEKLTVPPAPTPLGEKIDVTFNFHSADVREVIKVILGDFLKLNYVIDRKVAGVVTLHAVGQFYKEELKDIFQLTLNVNGLSMTEKDNLVEVTTIQEARQRTPKVYVGDDIQVHGENVITQIVPLKHIVPQGIIPTLRGFMSQAGFVVAPNDSHALVVAEQASNMERVLSIIKMFDVPIFAGKALKFYDVKYVDVKALAKELEDMARSLGAVTKGARAAISFTPFVESNRLLVATKSPELLSSIDFWIQNVDVESEERTTKLYIYKLQHQNAKELQPILTELYSEKISGQAGVARAGAKTPTDGKKRGARVEKTERGAVITEQPMRIIADEGTNSLLIKAVPSDYQEIRSIIDALDASPQQVLVEIIIAEVKLTEKLDEGVELFLKSKLKPSDVVGSTARTAKRSIEIVNPADLTTGALIDLTMGSVRTIFEMLASESTLNFLSTPHILVRDDQQASIQVGEDVPLVKGTTIQPTGGVDTALTQQIEYRDTGVLFTVTPHIAENGMVTLDITEEVSEIGEFIDVGGQRNPKIITRKAETSLIVKGGNTVLIGGIIQDKETNTISKVPLLGDIPVLGYLFKSTKNENNKTELLVLITPHIINTATDAETLTNEFEDRVKSLQRIIKGTTIGQKDYNIEIEYEEG